jgi:glycosyltransferase involved in cell wall biosynthesis
LSLKNLKILYILKNKIGGLGSVLSSLSTYFINSNNVTLDEFRINNISIYSTYKKFSNNIKKLVKDVDIVHFHGSWSPHIFSLITKKTTVTVVSPHGALHPVSLKKSWFKKKVAKFLYVKETYKNADCIHALTTQEIEDIHNFGIYSTPIALIPNGIDFGEMLNLEISYKNKLLNLANNRKVFLSLSRLDPAKGIGMMIDSFSQVLKTNTDMVLFIVGSGSDVYKNELLKKIEFNNLADNIFLLGELTGIYKNTVYDVSDIFILPSFHEGFGLTVIEAYRQKLPVITTTATIFKELKELQIGWYIEPTEKELYSAIKDAYIKDTNELKKMGQEGYTWVEANFSIEIHNKKMESLYMWLLGKIEKPDFIYGENSE